MKSNQLGDKHNFGSFVTVEEEWVIKPRTLFWEFLFLSEDSLLRSRLNWLFKKHLSYSPFDLFIPLAFKDLTKTSGKVQYIKMNDDEIGNLTELEVNQVGSLIAMCFWFGIGDLHIENMVIGRRENKLVCFPIDIESIFEKMTHVTQTLLLPSRKIPLDKCGLSKIISHIEREKALNIVKSFSSTVNLLNEHGYQILSEAMLKHDFSHPIRVIVRDTNHYKECLKKAELSSLYLSEKLQIERSDIPYFFRFHNSNEIYYWKSRSSFTKSEFDYTKLNLCSPVSTISGSKNFSKTYTAMLSIQHLYKVFDINVDSKNLNQLNLKKDNFRTTSISKENELKHA